MTSHTEDVSRIAPGEPPGTYPLTREQEAIWLNDAFTEGRSRYTVLWAHRLRGDVDPDAVEWALDQLVARHEALRSRFVMEPDGLRQLVGAGAPSRMERVVCPQGGLEERLQELAAGRLDLTRGPVRATLVQAGPDEWVVCLLIHHIVMDDWSLSLLDKEFSHFYRAHRADGLPSPRVLRPPALQLGQYAARQRARAVDEDALRHWCDRLQDLPESSTIRPDRPRPVELGHGGGRVPFRVPAQVADAVRAFARATRTTPFTVLTAAATALVHRHGSGNNVVLGTPVSRRGGADLDKLVGCLSDLMPVRVSVDAGMSFRDLVTSARGEVLELMRYREVPFSELVRRTVTGEDRSRFPLFQVVVAVNDSHDKGLDLPGVAAERLYVHPGTTKFDLCLDLAADAHGFRGFLDYSTDLYERDTARRIANRYCRLLESAMADSDLPLDELVLLPSEELALVTGAWAQAPAAPRPPVLVHEAFETQRRKTPEAPAAVWRDRQLTYEELGSASDSLARSLGRTGSRGQAVGILMERSLDMVMAVLAVLKSGAPYVPLDPAYPPDRLAYMIQDSGLHTLLTQPSLRDRCAVPETVRVLEPQDWQGPAGAVGEQTEPPGAGRDDLAYLMYTSGSTGVPKGVAMPHGAVAGLVDWQCRDSAAGPGDRTLQFSALSFDASFLEFFSTWSTGGTLVVIDAEDRTDYDALLSVIAGQRVMRIFLPFVALQSIATYATAMDLPTPALKECITAGEQLHVTPAIREFFARLDGGTLFNQYGPTETHSVSSLRLDGDPASWPLMPTVGFPINGAQVYILDERLRPQPAGVPGELCVSGPPVSHGYWRRPDLTAEKFVRHPLPGRDGTLYRTGDVARFLPDGSIEFLGRKDGMVKIRGYRVELGEVEARLRTVPGVADAAIVAQAVGIGDTRLAAYYRPSTSPGPDSSDLRRVLAETLPDYMLPSVYLPVEHEFPRTPSGKVDRLALARSSATQS
ncbi:amino acid adenylation domain-containing protein [Streptomyces sp. NPDC090798]|uniref:non-ribosomal peptide synthetase n=1 Tax=Streptomyces sp. NPDC090798 TaxID=3365968 RepID=UPI003809EBF9